MSYLGAGIAGLTLSRQTPEDYDKTVLLLEKTQAKSSGAGRSSVIQRQVQGYYL